MAPSRDPKNRSAMEAGASTQQQPGQPESLGDVHFAGANFGDAVAYYENALRGLPVQAEPSDRVRILLKVAEAHRQHGQYQAALEAVARAEALLAPETPGAPLGKVLGRKAALLNLGGLYRDSLETAGISYRLLRDSNENLEVAHLELAMGVSHARQGDFATARDFFERALASFKRIDSEEGAALAYNNLGLVAKNSGDLAGALRFLERALRINERLGNYSRVTLNCLNLGIVRFKLGEWDIAREYLERCMVMARDTEDYLARASALNSLACLLRRKRSYEAAEAALRESRELCEKHGYRRDGILSLEFLGEVEADRGRLEQADALYETGLKAAEELAPEGDVTLEIVRRLGDLRLRQGRLADAEACGRRALDLARRQHDRLEEAASWRLLALAAGRRGDISGYTALMDQAIQQLTEVGERFELASALYAAGSLETELYEDRRDGHMADRAGRHLRRASALFVSFDCEYYLAHTTLKLARLDLAQGRLDQALTELEEALNYSGSFRSSIEERAAELRSSLEVSYLQGSASSSNDFRLLEDVNRVFREAGSRDWSEALVQLLAERFPADVVFLAEREGGDCLLRAHLGLRAESALDIAVALSEQCMMVGRPVFSTRAASDPMLPARAASLLSGMGSIAALPLGAGDQVHGILFLGRGLKSATGPLRQRELDLLVALSSLIAAASVEARRQALWEENRSLKEGLKLSGAADGIVTQSPQMLDILRLVDKVSDATASVLLQGETGTGKGLIARAIHQRSHRRDKAFVPINCAALPEPLLESELFGHVSGAFTGASRDKLGLFEEAEGGTVFLDEVDRLSEAVQGKLLHVLDRGEIRAVGSNHWKTVNVRVICATNADLKIRIASGRFLEDLYYRLNDILIQVPALRTRREDIPLLADFFRHQFAAQFTKDVGEFTPEVRQHFLDHPWRGNVREIEKVVKRMVVLADPRHPLGADLLPEEFYLDAPPVTTGARGKLWAQVAEMERKAIGQALEASRWNKSQAARELGISYPSLLQKIKMFGLDRRVRVKSLNS